MHNRTAIDEDVMRRRKKRKARVQRPATRTYVVERLRMVAGYNEEGHDVSCPYKGRL